MCRTQTRTRWPKLKRYQSWLTSNNVFETSYKMFGSNHLRNKLKIERKKLVGDNLDENNSSQLRTL